MEFVSKGHRAVSLVIFGASRNQHPAHPVSTANLSHESIRPMIIGFTIAFGLIHGGLLAAAWRAARRLTTPSPAVVPPASWPPVRIVLPIAGAANSLEASLDDLAAQAYPDFEIHLACHAEDEAACASAEAWIRKQESGPRVTLARAATARFCSQKNRNLLAAVQSPAPADQILVFTDAGYRRPADWLRGLVAPIATGQASVTTGYYFAAAGRGWQDTLRPVTAMLLFLVQQVPTLRQTWGGATALSRKLFDELDMATLWSTHIVDDVVLAQRLRRARIPIRGINRPTLLAPAMTDSDFNWGEWFTRQLGYIRALQPMVWAGLGIGFGLLAAGILWMAGMILQAGGSSPALWPAGIAGMDALLLTAFGLRLRALHPEPGPRLHWLAAFFGFMLGAPVCHLRTALSRDIRWRGIRYRVAPGGAVLSTSARPEEPAESRPESGPTPPPSEKAPRR